MTDTDRETTRTAIEALGPLRGIRSVPAAGLVAPSGVVFRGLYVGTTGDVTIETEEGQTVTLSDLAAGLWHGVYFRKVIAGFTASNVLVGR
jgi:hypothetical protein